MSRLAVALGFVALLASIGFQGLDVLDQPVTAALSPKTWSEGLASTFGTFVAIALVGFVLALSAAASLRLARVLSLLALLSVGVALATTGHASTADPQWLMRPAVFLHTTIVAFWVGALAPLAMLLRGPPEIALQPLRRFSGAIRPLLVLLIAAGTALAVVQIGSPAELVGTGYGRVFLTKMGLVAVVLCLAAFNRWRLTHAVLGDAAAARHRLCRSIIVELGIVFAIFGIVGLWRFTPPPRALLEAAAQPLDLHLMTSEAMAEMVVTPGRAGPVAVDVAIMGPAMGPLPAEGVTIAFANKARGVEPIERQAKLQPDGSWRVADLTLPLGGTWQVKVEILVSDFKEIDLVDSLALRP
jgi:copper transport protein